MAPKRKGADCIENPLACVFCKKEDDDEFVYGKFFHMRQLSVHHNCMFFSSGLEQRTRSSSNGILGFKIEDIKKEVNRGKKLRCTYCKQTGATVGCCIGSCRKTFHFPCGMINHTLHQYFGTFNSYCKAHKPVQIYVKTPRDAFHCHICYSSLSKTPMENCLYATCCKNNWYHKICLQKYAISAGRHFFKCPMCKNSSDFNKVAETYGIHIPEKDASWELEENAFQELYYRPQCGASICHCDEGKKFDGDGEWELLFCKLCGSKATHRFCERLSKHVESWQCSECKVLEDQLNKKVVLPQVSLHKSTLNEYLNTQFSQGSSLSNKEPSFNSIHLSSHASSLLSVSSLQQALRCVVEVTPFKIVTDDDGFIKPVLNPNNEFVKVKPVKKNSASKRKKYRNTENKKCKKGISVEINKLESKKGNENAKRKMPIESVKNKKLCLQEKVMNAYNNEQFKEDLSNSKEKYVMANKEQPVVTYNGSSIKAKVSPPLSKKIKSFKALSNCCSNNSCISKYFGFDCPNKKKILESKADGKT